MSDGDDTADGTSEEVTVDAHRRRWLPGTLVVLATLLAIVCTTTTWVRSQALDTDQWVEMSEDLLAEQEVRDALSTYLAAELLTEVDMQAHLASLLPEELSALAGPLSGALQGPATAAVDRLVSSDRFDELWLTANRTAHTAVVAVLRGESRGNLTTADGMVVLDLGAAVRTIGADIGIPDAALDRIPPDAGQIVIFDSDELAQAQDAVTVLDFTSWFLYLVVVAMYVIAVVIAVGRRRVMLRMVGVSLAAGGLALLAIRAIGIRTSVNIFVEDPANESLARLAGSVLTELLRQMAWTGIIYGVLIVGFAELLGNHRWAVAVRRAIGGATDSIGAVVVVAALVLLLLVWWSPGRAFDRWATALTLLALAIAAVVTLILAGRRELATTSARTADSGPDVR